MKKNSHTTSLKLKAYSLKLLTCSVVIFLILFVSCRKKALSPPPVMPPSKAIPKPVPPQPPAIKPPLLPTVKKPAKIAIIIDDFGYNDELAKEVIEMPFPIAISVLPRLKYSEWTAKKAKAAGKPVLLHLPVEAFHGNESLGPGAIFTTMNDEDIKQTFTADLATVPEAQGVNNHMGSKGTSDPHVAELIAEEAKAHGLFVVDSETSSHSFLYSSARKLRIKSAARDIFLDNSNDEKEIESRIDELIAEARRQGEAIAIGHPRPNTLKVLHSRLPELKKEKIEIVPVTELLKN